MPCVAPWGRKVAARKSILVFDSGLGGLTVYREIAAVRPDADFLYVADDAAFPYGALTASVLLIRHPLDTPSGTASAAQPDALPADLALVPADAVGFIHIRLADLWKNEVMAGFRKTWEKAGPKALAELDKQFVPAPSTISRGTAPRPITAPRSATCRPPKSRSRKLPPRSTRRA